MISVLPYKYDYDLSSKQKICLWMYQLIPNIDIIKYIYQLKEDIELYETKLYHGLSPKYITITGGSWKPININDTWSTMTKQIRMKFNVMCIKFIMEPGFICTFTFHKEDYTMRELEEMEHWNNWVYIVPNINFHPPLKDKIKCIDWIFEIEPYLEDDIYIRLDRVYQYYQNNELCRIGIDQTGKYYIPTF